MRLSGKHGVLVDLVGHGVDVSPFTKGGEGVDLGRGEDPSSRIVRRVQHRARRRRVRRGVERRLVQHEARRRSRAGCITPPAAAIAGARNG